MRLMDEELLQCKVISLLSDKIVSLYKERLYGVIYNMTFNHEDSADLTQDTFVKAFVLLL